MRRVINMRRERTGILFVSAMLFAFLGCDAYWSVSDTEAVRLVEEYYLFFREGKEVDARIIRREPYSGECACYPIIFKIIAPGEEEHQKIFYFFKNKDGKIEVSEFRSVVR